MFNPTSLKYTWISSSDNTYCSRLDYWLISHTLCKDILKCEVSASPLTDTHNHCMINIQGVIVQQNKKSDNIWKLNNNLLFNPGFCRRIIDLYRSVNMLEMSNLNKWEWFKFRLKQIAVDTGK